MILSIFTLILFFVSWLAFNTALHVPQQNAIPLFFKSLFFLVNTLLVTVFAKAFVLVFYCDIFLTISSLFTPLLLLLFAVFILLASGSVVLFLQWNSLGQQFVYFLVVCNDTFRRNHRCWSILLETYSWVVLWNQFNLLLSTALLFLLEHVCAHWTTNWSFFSWIAWRLL